ncbi:hypothetical protein AVEN_258402-1 [Araneus ventricosus]|uniref:Uncharacterized protein n=1 Tax=Araneus ventricosus TaxID=182803 RepID=A0A4Y2KAD1_ARAVE|nr:hypothetical protein AVEN_258402-1 [Araneus ventricosus]
MRGTKTVSPIAMPVITIARTMFGPRNLFFLGCDGIVVNTGVFNGVIRRLELKLHRPIQWIIGLLHFNEFPLRQLFERKSSGPSSYTGDTGRNLKRCEKLPLVAFNSIECDLVALITNKSCDQKYLLDICTAISSGVGSSDLVKRQLGTLNLLTCYSDSRPNFLV